MIWPIAIFVISLALFSFRLNAFPLWNWDEAWYAEIIKNMAAGRGLFLPFWNGESFFDKPPLYYWLDLPIVKLFGVGEWQTRLVSVIAGAFVVTLIYLIGRFLFGHKAGFLSAIIFITTGPVIFRFSSVSLDSLMIFLSLGVIYLFLLSFKNPRFIWLSGIFLGLSLLVKSWLLGSFPFGLIFLYSLFVDRRLLKKIIIIGLTGILIGGWWYVLGSLVYGRKFVDWYIFSPGAGNFLKPEIYFSDSYLRTLISDIGLWFIPLLFCIPRILHQKKREVLEIALFIAYSLSYFIILNFASDKYGWYLLPIYPYFALSAGYILSRIEHSKDKFILALIFLSFFGQMFRELDFYRRDPDRSLIGARLGNFVSQKVSFPEKVILDDQDFSAFLYYSNLQRIIVVLPKGGKSNEYWIKSYEQLKEFPRPFWLVTRDWQGKSLGLPVSIINIFDGYQLVKFDSSINKF